LPEHGELLTVRFDPPGFVAGTVLEMFEQYRLGVVRVERTGARYDAAVRVRLYGPHEAARSMEPVLPPSVHPSLGS
jgi:hypothetical protein